MEISADQKVLVLTQQRRLLTARVEVQNAQNDYAQVVNKLIADLKLDPVRQRLDLDNLTIVDVLPDA